MNLKSSVKIASLIGVSYLLYKYKKYNNKAVLLSQEYTSINSNKRNNYDNKKAYPEIISKNIKVNNPRSNEKKATLYIVINKENKTQELLVNKLLEKIDPEIKDAFKIQFITSKVSSGNYNYNVLVNYYNNALFNSSLNKSKKTNIPILLLSNNSNSFISEVDASILLNTPNKGNNILANMNRTHEISKYTELRNHFEYIKSDPRMSIYLIKEIDNKNNVSKDFLTYLSLFNSSKSKILIIKAKDIVEKLDLKDNIVYEYKALKYPNKLKASSLDRLLEEESAKLYNSDITENDNDSDNDDEVKEPINENQLGKFAGVNPISFMLQYNIFRNEYSLIEKTTLPFDFSSINEKNIYGILNKKYRYMLDKDNKDTQVNDNNTIIISNEYARYQMINNFFYVKRNITELAETREEIINEDLKEKNKFYAFLYSLDKDLSDEGIKSLLFGKNP